jgi:hypothetical protein
MDSMEIVGGMSRLVLGWVFLVVGGLQVFLPKAEAARLLGGWAHGYPDLALKFVGQAQILAGAAAVLPLIVTLPAGLQAAAAGIIIVLMGLSVVVHARQRQYLRLTASALLAGLAGFNVHRTLIG